MCLHPSTEATGVVSRADSGDALAWIAYHLPQMFQPFTKPIHGSQIHQAQKIALVWPVQDMEGIGEVGQHPAVLAPRSLRLRCTLYGPRYGNRIKLSPPSQRARYEGDRYARGLRNNGVDSLELQCPFHSHTHTEYFPAFKPVPCHKREGSLSPPAYLTPPILAITSEAKIT